MSLQADAARLRTGMGAVTAAVQRDLRGFWGTLNLNNPEAARNALVAYVPRLVDRYGDAANAVAADWYEQTRAAQLGARYGTFRTVLAAAVPAAAMESTVRYSAGHLFTENPIGTFLLLNGAVQRQTLQSARETIVDNVARDPARPKYARVVKSAHPCEFCLMLASRGAVYPSEEAATIASGRSKRAGLEFHDHCDCQPVAVFR